MLSTFLGKTSTPKGLSDIISKTFGNGSHLWMYDALSMKKECLNAGFTDIRLAGFNDSDDRKFIEVEDI